MKLFIDAVIVLLILTNLRLIASSRIDQVFQVSLSESITGQPLSG